MKKIKIICKGYKFGDPDPVVVFFKEDVLQVCPEIRSFVGSYDQLWATVKLKLSEDKNVVDYFHNDTGPAFSTTHPLFYRTARINEYYLDGTKYRWKEWNEKRRMYRQKIKFQHKLSKIIE